MLQLRTLACCLIVLSTFSAPKALCQPIDALKQSINPSGSDNQPQASSQAADALKQSINPAVTDNQQQNACPPAAPPTHHVKRRHFRMNSESAMRLAGYHWLDKDAEANPTIIEAITEHPTAASKLASHPRLGDIAEADHYLCRRLTRYRSASFELARNGQAERVIALDPEGMYRAIARWPSIMQVLAKNPLFDQMMIDTPDLGTVMSQHI